MDAELAQGIDLSLQRQHAEAPHDLDWMLPELLMELTPDLAEPILVKYWEALQSIPIFFQTALFINTPTTRELAADAFDQAPDRFVMLEHVTSHFGVRETGRSHRVTLTHFKALEPYLDYCSKQVLLFLWHECNSRHWFEWRRNYIDPRVSKIDDDRFRSDVSSREALLDKLCRQRPVWPEWVDRNLLDLGYSLEEAFMIIVKWAEKKGTKRAMEVAAELFFNEAHRSHLPLFDRLVAGKTDCALLRSDDVHFAVKYRTLQ